jgi:hypothetical protein
MPPPSAPADGSMSNQEHLLGAIALWQPFSRKVHPILQLTISTELREGAAKVKPDAMLYILGVIKMDTHPGVDPLQGMILAARFLDRELELKRNACSDYDALPRLMRIRSHTGEPLRFRGNMEGHKTRACHLLLERGLSLGPDCGIGLVGQPL